MTPVEAHHTLVDRRAQWALAGGVVAAVGALVTPFAGIVALVTIVASVWLLVKGVPKKSLLWWAIALSALSLVVLTAGTLAFGLTVA